MPMPLPQTMSQQQNLSSGISFFSCDFNLQAKTKFSRWNFGFHYESEWFFPPWALFPQLFSNHQFRKTSCIWSIFRHRIFGRFLRSFRTLPPPQTRWFQRLFQTEKPSKNKIFYVNTEITICHLQKLDDFFDPFVVPGKSGSCWFAKHKLSAIARLVHFLQLFHD